MASDNTQGELVSNLSGVDINRKLERRDTKGNKIEKQGQHHATFIDEKQPGTPVHQVKEVQAYKNGSGGGCCTIS